MDGRRTNKRLKDLLPKALDGIALLHRDRPDLVVGAWPGLVGEKLAPMTQAVSFEGGILHVLVNNSTLYSVLSQHEKGRLLMGLRNAFPSLEIKNIHFRMGNFKV